MTQTRPEASVRVVLTIRRVGTIRFGKHPSHDARNEYNATLLEASEGQGRPEGRTRGSILGPIERQLG